MTSIPQHPSRRALMLGAMSAGVAAAIASPASADLPDVIDLRVRHARAQLHSAYPETRDLSDRAKGILIMPSINKAGILIGGAYGEGSLLMNDRSVGYYSLASASLGLQAGVQRFNQAIFFMTTAALERFRRAEGWEVGADAMIASPDANLAATLTSTTGTAPVIVINFGQEGLMAGISISGAKYTRIHH